VTSVLARLYEHMVWADLGARDALRAMPAGSPTLARAVELFAHVAGAEHVWLCRLEGRPAEFPVWPALELEAAARLAADSGQALRALVSRLDDAGLAREVEYVNSAGRSFRTRADDILLQVATHGSYHRGQIALLTRDGGGQPAGTDYVSFVRGVPAATRR
jgi:uncharacterized damage-inducible protein DinB